MNFGRVEWSVVVVLTTNEGKRGQYSASHAMPNKFYFHGTTYGTSTPKSISQQPWRFTYSTYNYWKEEIKGF